MLLAIEPGLAAIEVAVIAGIFAIFNTLLTGPMRRRTRNLQKELKVNHGTEGTFADQIYELHKRNDLRIRELQGSIDRLYAQLNMKNKPWKDYNDL